MTQLARFLLERDKRIAHLVAVAPVAVCQWSDVKRPAALEPRAWTPEETSAYRARLAHEFAWWRWFQYLDEQIARRKRRLAPRGTSFKRDRWFEKHWSGALVSRFTIQEQSP
jgi:hypothetical protein